jgi:DNA-directed RNA polymerase subunit RPC12/RpoP
MMKVQIPWELHQAIVRVQAQDDLSFEDACLKIATLSDSARKEYQKAVLGEADRLARSRSMIQINKSRKTIQDSAYKGGYDSGYKVGYDTGYGTGYNAALTQFRYLCAGCGQTIYAGSQNEWKWLVENGHLSTWRCPNCLKRRT